MVRLISDKSYQGRMICLFGPKQPKQVRFSSKKAPKVKYLCPTSDFSKFQIIWEEIWHLKKVVGEKSAFSAKIYTLALQGTVRWKIMKHFGHRARDEAKPMELWDLEIDQQKQLHYLIWDIEISTITRDGARSQVIIEISIPKYLGGQEVNNDPYPNLAAFCHINPMIFNH